MFPAGTYWMENLKLGTGKSPDKGTPYLWIQGDITNMAVEDGWQPVANPEQRTVKVYLSNSAMPYSKPKLEALGFNGDYVNPSLSNDATQKGIEVECKVETYNGKQRDKFELPGSGGGHQSLDADEIRKLNNMWKAAKADDKKPAPKPAAKPTAKPAAPPKPPAPKPPAAPDFDKDRAWGVLLKACQDAATADDTEEAVTQRASDEWARIYGLLFENRPEEDMTAMDWEAFAKRGPAMMLPF
jgi:hypothetical protein